ncbi:MAG TPA: hypothetical protein VEK08_11675, partial [Planctomycetota bacterium]|nr:hypothetical protein [Planctomycetota bacterium]
EFLPDVPAIPAVVPPAAEKAAAPAKMAAAAAAIAARNAEARLKSDNPGQHLDSATQWATIGTLPVIASARRLEISLRNEGGAHAYGGMICLRPWNLMEAPVSLQFDARNLLARSSQDLDFIITDDLKLKNDMRQLSIQAALNLKRVRSKLATGASPQRIEVVFSRSQNGSVRQELRAGNEVLLTRYSEKLRDLRHVYIGFRASTRHDSSHTVLSIDNVKLAYRPRTVPWISSFEDAQTLAQARGEAFCVYFCDPESAKLAGEGPAALAEYKAGHIQTPPPSVFETPLVLAEFQSAGVDLFVKIPAAPENAQLFARYADRLPALILCAPDGTRLGGFTGVECKQTALVKFLSSEFSDVLSQWHASQKASRPAAATPTLELPPAAVAIPERQVFQLLPLHESLPRAYRFSARVAAGPRVATAEQYRVLKDMGVKTLLSVDGTAPDGAACEALKIRGVHLPLGFAGFTTEQTRALARALRDLPAPVYVQAAEGTRAYTASALALVVLGQIEPADAIGALKTAGVPSLSALYSAVASARPDAQAAELNTIAFAPHAPVSPLVQEMLQIDTIWRRLEKARAQGWRVSEEGRGELARDAHLLLERYLELSKSETITHDKAKAMMSDSVAAAASLAYTLAAWKKNPGAEEMATVNAGFNRTTASCLNCHAQVRDRKK